MLASILKFNNTPAVETVLSMDCGPNFCTCTVMHDTAMGHLNPLS